MLEREILDELSSVRPSESCTFVLEWRAEPDAALFENIASKRERLNTLVQFYRTIKAPLLQHLAGEGADVTDIPTSAQAIVTAPAERWRALATELAKEGAVRVLPNRLYNAV
jgi:hypothetical protein